MEMNFDQLDKKVADLVADIENSYVIKGLRIHAGDLDRELTAADDFDDSGWENYENATIHRGQGIVWLRMKYTVPDKVHGVSITGTQLRVAGKIGGFSVPSEFYIDGRCALKETAWMDFKCPEAIISESAVPGEEHTLAVRFDMIEKCFYNTNVDLVVVPKNVEMMAFEISSIGDELRYIAPLASAKELLPEAYKAVEVACELKETEAVLEAIRNVRKMLEPVREEAKKCTLHMIGHAHIDMNWFWSMEETRQVVARDFDTMSRLLEQYPDFRFSQSQCEVYKIAKEDCPEVFERVKKLEKEGKWDCTASAWVEGDMNMADGEAVSRHMLYSKKYLKAEGIKEPEIMWCPDTFGHGANVPQLLNQGGVKYYYHMRCPQGINDEPAEAVKYMRHSYHDPVYWWQGADGSRVLTTSLIYNASVWTDSMLHASAAMRDRYNISRAMYIYGTGDHGGGPTKRDIEKIHLMDTYPTTPKLLFSTTHEFYHAVEESEDLSRLPVVEGELNFIYDGCYTTHGDIKRDNRQSENWLDAAERLCVLAALQGFSYPGERFELLWRDTLFNQFHDIFDGSGVPDSYEYSNALADNVLKELHEICEEAMGYIGSRMKTDAALGTPFMVFNPAAYEREECIFIKEVDTAKTLCIVDAHGNKVQSQVCAEGIRAQVKLPASGLSVFYVQETEAAETDESFTLREEKEYYYIDSEVYSAEIRKASGEITSLYDKQNKRFVARREDLGWRMAKGRLNTLEIHHEMPGEMSSWLIHDVVKVNRLVTGAESRIVEDGALMKVIEFVHRFGESEIRQQIRIGKYARRIDFHTNVTWGEYGSETRLAPMLRVVHTPYIDNKEAVYDSICGITVRDLKDEEYPALKWVASDGSDYGFALLNDCKYGYRVKGNMFELALIRSGWTPDPKSDIGEHEFTYSILPYAGSYKDADVVEEAYFLNRPVVVKKLAETEGTGANGFLAATDVKSAVISGIKKAETEDAVIVRIFDIFGKGCAGNLNLGFEIDKAVTSNTLEETLEEAVYTKNAIPFTLTPFEQKCYKIYPVCK